MNRWMLTDEIKNRIKPLLVEWFEFVENLTEEQLERVELSEPLEIDLSDKGINPYQLETLLKEFGYDTDDRDDNGWERDFWIFMSRKDGRHFTSGCENIAIMCCGMTFELKVYIQDEY